MIFYTTKKYFTAWVLRIALELFIYLIKNSNCSPTLEKYSLYKRKLKNTANKNLNMGTDRKHNLYLWFNLFENVITICLFPVECYGSLEKNKDTVYNSCRIWWTSYKTFRTKPAMACPFYFAHYFFVINCLYLYGSYTKTDRQN